MRAICVLSAVAGLAALSGTALATTGTVNSGFSFENVFLTPGVTFTLNAVPLTEPTASFNGDRINGNPGTDTTVPDLYRAYCIEIGVDLFNPTVPHNAYPLLGGTTTNGGLTGPITFDAVRTDRLQRLWGTFEAGVNDVGSAAAFQLAIWELAFDNDQTLVGPGFLFVDAGQFQPGISDLAESYLAVIRGGGGVSTNLILLATNNGGENGADSQDIITTPAPGSAMILGLAGLAGLRRRRR